MKYVLTVLAVTGWLATLWAWTELFYRPLNAADFTMEQTTIKFALALLFPAIALFLTVAAESKWRKAKK